MTHNRLRTITTWAAIITGAAILGTSLAAILLFTVGLVITLT